MIDWVNDSDFELETNKLNEGFLNYELTDKSSRTKGDFSIIDQNPQLLENILFWLRWKCFIWNMKNIVSLSGYGISRFNFDAICCLIEIDCFRHNNDSSIYSIEKRYHFQINFWVFSKLHLTIVSNPRQMKNILVNWNEIWLFVYFFNNSWTIIKIFEYIFQGIHILRIVISINIFIRH